VREQTDTSVASDTKETGAVIVNDLVDFECVAERYGMCGRHFTEVPNGDRGQAVGRQEVIPVFGEGQGVDGERCTLGRDGSC